MSVRIIIGDCTSALPALAAEGFRAHSAVTDPPYGIGFMGREWDRADNVAFRPETWAAVRACLLPGAHLLAFGGTRQWHRLAVAIEDAGFEIRDTLAWLYGSGFPKSLNLDGGLGTALKPAFEPIILARKPLIGTVAANILAHGTGAINIDVCRIPSEKPVQRAAGAVGFGAGRDDNYAAGAGREYGTAGRWPANVIHDGSDEVEAAFAAFGQAPGQQRAVGPQHGAKKSVNCYGDFGARSMTVPRGDTGTASRFFYSAKADSDDRAGSKHPTVKPTDLMRYLVKLVTPVGGTVLDPFAGTGSTALAADQLNMNAVLIEQSAEYAEDARRKFVSDAGLFADVLN